MKKIKIMLTLFFVTLVTVDAQEVTVQLFRKINCNGVEYVNKIGAETNMGEINIISLIKDSIMYPILDTVPIMVQDTGKYVLNAISMQNQDSSIYIKNDSKVFVDTVSFASIYEALVNTKNTEFTHLWLCCDNKCEGYQVEYYDNGNKRIEGTFKNGKAIGNINYYDQRGKLISIL